MTELRPGDRLGRYALIRPIGRGGMGDVWEAELQGPQGFRKPVALKLLLSSQPDAALRQALLREARVGALLQHPNVVGTLDLGEVEGRIYVAMDLVRGASLSELLATGPLPGSALLETGVQACAALQHVHGLEVDGRRAGLVHRDVKPANLLLDRTGVLRLADLGIARLATDPGGVAGTPGYAAPEQFAGLEDDRADLFALGMTLLTLASGMRPLGRGAAARDGVLRIEEHLRDPAFLARAESAAPGLGAILNRCLQRDPARRFGTAAELGRALASLQARVQGPLLLDLLSRARPDLKVEVPTASLTRGSDAPTLVLAGNIRAPSDDLVGRTEELDALAARLRAAPGVLTLHGPGGVGKTRLALEVARRLSRELPGAAWFVELADARTEEGLLYGVASALRVPIDRSDPVGQLGFALRARGAALVVLDNLEQVIEAAAAVVARWLDAAPEMRFVVTSRLPLRVVSEHVVAVGPLTEEQGVELFLRRAALASADRGVVAEIVRGVDGLPLAIELAAARTRHLQVEAIRDRLSQRLKLLAGGDRNRPERQQSLRASLDGSWELLAEWGRRALSQLAVFEGGFELEAAEAVTDLSVGGDAPWALDVVEALADACLLQVDAASGRFRMREVVREYAIEKAPAGDVAAAEVRHGRYYAQLGSPASLEEFRKHPEAPRAVRLLLDLDNVVAAARRAIRRGDGSVAEPSALAAAQVLLFRGPLASAVSLLEPLRPLAGPQHARATAALADLYRTVGRRAEARSLADEVVAASPGTTAHVAALLVRANLAREDHRPAEADEYHTRARDLCNALGELGIEARVRANQALVLFEQGQLTQAVEVGRATLALLRSCGDRRSEAVTLGTVAMALTSLGRHEEAVEAYRSALAIHRRQQDRRYEGVVQMNLGSCYVLGERLELAREAYEAALAVTIEVGDRPFEGRIRGNLGSILGRLGDPDAAAAELEQGLAVLREVGNVRSAAIVLQNLARLDLGAGRLVEAGRRLEEAYAVAARSDDARLVGMVAPVLGGLLHELGDTPRATRLVQQVLALPVEARVDGTTDALLLGARIALDAGDARSAVRDAAAAREHAETYGRPGGFVAASAALVEAALAAGAIETARDALGRLGVVPGTDAEGDVAVARGLLACAEGDTRTARARFDEAATLLGQDLVALAWVEAARASLGGDDAVAAVAAVARIASRLGLPPDAPMLRRRVRLPAG